MLGAALLTPCGPTAQALAQDSGLPGRGPLRPITVYCVAESFDFRLVDSSLAPARWAGAPERVDTDVVYVPFLSPPAHGAGATGTPERNLLGDVFLFDYGVVVLWGLSPAQEAAVLTALLVLNGAAVTPLPPGLRERDVFEVCTASLAPPPPGTPSTKALISIANGVIALDQRFSGDPLAQLAVSHAIAQSTKLSVFESRVTRLAETSAYIPTTLAATGIVRMHRREATRLTGQLFLQRSAVNLLSTVLDVPAFFWDAPDDLQGLYSQVTKYLELKNRVAVLNARYQVLEAMLLMVQQQLNEAHAVRLELIINVLIAIGKTLPCPRVNSHRCLLIFPGAFILRSEIGLGLAELWLLHAGALGH